jgi:hypothetical protein
MKNILRQVFSKDFEKRGIDCRFFSQEIAGRCGKILKSQAEKGVFSGQDTVIPVQLSDWTYF